MFVSAGCGDGCPPCDQPCSFLDDFDAGDARWTTAELSGGTAPVFTRDDVSDRMTATGDGSLTMQVSPPSGSGTIYVEADVFDPGSSTATGVTIRAADSDDRISLVRVWGTTNGYELRQGTTVLQSFTDAGGNPIRLEIVSPSGPTTDVKCYVAGVLVHTETGVSWTLPDVLNLGIIAEDGGEWDDVTISPCPTSCPLDVICVGASTLPMSWRLDATAITGTATAGTCARDICGKYARVYGFAFKTRVAAYISGGLGCTLNPDAGWVAASYNLGAGCYWLPVFSRRRIANRPPITETGLENAYPILRLPNCDDPHADCANPCGGAAGICDVDPDFHQFPLIEVETRNIGAGDEIRIRLYFFDVATTPASNMQAEYYSPWAADPQSYETDPLVLTLDGSTDLLCTWPATLTLEPNGSLKLAKALAGCGGDCEPIFGDGDLGIIRFPGTLGGVAFGLCLARAFDETDPDAEHVWQSGGLDEITLSCGTKTWQVRIRCGAVEGAEPGWVIDLINITDDITETFPLTVTLDGNGDIAATVSETVTAFCGSDVLVGDLSACSVANLPFTDCCDEEDYAALCCYDFDNFPVEGTVTQLDPEGVAGTGDDCVGSAETMGYTEDALSLNSGGSPYTPSGFVPANGYLRGAWPFDTNPWLLVLYCDGGTLKAFAYDATNSNEIGLAELSLLSQSCIGGYIEWDDAEALCYTPGGVRRRIDFG